MGHLLGLEEAQAGEWPWSVSFTSFMVNPLERLARRPDHEVLAETSLTVHGGLAPLQKVQAAWGVVREGPTPLIPHPRERRGEIPPHEAHHPFPHSAFTPSPILKRMG